MIKRNSTVETIKKLTISHMQVLGTYKPEYDVLITVFADTVRAYNRAMQQFIQGGEVLEVETENGATKKSGTASALEVLRKDVQTLSDRLMLNPKTNLQGETVTKTTQTTDIEDLFEKLDEKLSA